MMPRELIKIAKSWPTGKLLGSTEKDCVLGIIAAYEQMEEISSGAIIQLHEALVDLEELKAENQKLKALATPVSLRGAG